MRSSRATHTPRIDCCRSSTKSSLTREAKAAHQRNRPLAPSDGAVHEAYVRLVGNDPDQPWNGRGHFYGAAAEAMRRILVESAASRRRGSNTAANYAARTYRRTHRTPEPREDLVALDDALSKLSFTNRQAANLVELRYSAGLTLPEAADTLNMAPRTAGRLWAFARRSFRARNGQKRIT